jgi:hypothetical protein
MNDQQKEALEAAGWTVGVARPRVYHVASEDGETTLYIAEDDDETADLLLNPPTAEPS